ncbi:sugar ABC transporter substrate-binding protein [Protaetiibacter sp. SSC-01]|uniref:sugar ABC transporter substrate-binding protein n=1 Tax=Protaetiibacter sp. SSC-01 TaxID=2759943 RepID=UPI0016570EB6|nr:sugar ABC transporter substrate-binding protein [Protaetiibacter sp. SSC-01]QNO36888.1 sugar ABC transporter substrate-binding protein [Protaetiibacter sp. SSC-01]
MITEFGKRGRRGLALGALALAGVMLAGCSIDGSSNGSKDGGDDTYTVGIVSYDTTTLSAKSETDGAKTAMEAEGWEVLSQDPKGDAAQANTICTQYVTRQVDAIVISVFDTNQMAQCMTGAAAAQIPVFYLAGSLADGVAGAISTTAASPVNEYMIEQIKDLPKLKILAMTLQPGAPCRAREADLDEKLEAAGLSDKIEKHEVVVPGQVTDAQNATAAWLQANPESEGSDLVIWACFSDPAMGAYAALQQADRDVPIYTWDFSDQVVEPLRSGDISAVLYIDAAGEGGQLVELIKAHLAGEDPQEVDANTIIVTPDNLEEFLAEHPEYAA